MKITDIIRAALDIIEKTQSVEEPATEPVQVAAEPDADCCEPTVDELIVIQRLAGTAGATEPDYANEPEIIVAPTQAAYPSGDDMHYSKNPADIRTNAPSMYPGYQAGVK